jgi:hypothetical protein
MSTENVMQPCAHCGWQPLDGTLESIVYPTGLHAIWLGVGTPAQALHLQKVPGHPSMAQWGAQCLESRGGCGAKVWGLAREGAIAAWNRRPASRVATPPTDDELRRVVVMVPMYSDDGNHAYHIRLARAVLAAYGVAASHRVKP